MVDTLPSHFQVKLDSPQGAYALLTLEPSAAVVFVHGFFGDARTTWIDFQGLADDLEDDFPSWGESDIYFYSYPSRDAVKPQAEDLLKFLHEQVLPGRPKTLTESKLLPSAFEIAASLDVPRAYQRLQLVGHSTGAVIIRAALIRELESLTGREGERDGGDDEVSKRIKESLLLGSSVKFFAPAHLGAMCSGFLGFAMNAPVLEVIAALELQARPLFKDIQQNSPTLTTLQRKTERGYSKYGPNALKALSLFGSEDSIVFQGQYDHEVEIDSIKKQTHTSICKLKWGYLTPLEYLVNA